jgi:hypothetical protein
MVMVELDTTIIFKDMRLAEERWRQDGFCDGQKGLANGSGFDSSRSYSAS